MEQINVKNFENVEIPKPNREQVGHCVGLIRVMWDFAKKNPPKDGWSEYLKHPILLDSEGNSCLTYDFFNTINKGNEINLNDDDIDKIRKTWIKDLYPQAGYDASMSTIRSGDNKLS